MQPRYKRIQIDQLVRIQQLGPNPLSEGAPKIPKESICLHCVYRKSGRRSRDDAKREDKTISGAHMGIGAAAHQGRKGVEEQKLISALEGSGNESHYIIDFLTRLGGAIDFDRRAKARRWSVH